MNNQSNEGLFNFNDELETLDQLWQLKTIAESDSHLFKIIKFEGEFEWHSHDESKTLIVLDGKMHIDFRDKKSVYLTKGDVFVVSEEIEHKPVGDGVCGIVLIEKKAASGDA